MRTTLLITLENAHGRALPLARVSDPGLLRLVADAALEEKRRQVERLQRSDKALAFVAEEELRHLERVLAGLVPRHDESKKEKIQ